MKHHDLKSWPVPFNDVERGEKKFEYRINDRDFKRGDTCTLHLWKPVNSVYEGSTYGPFKITSVLSEGFGVPNGFCVFSIGELVESPSPHPTVSMEDIEGLPRTAFATARDLVCAANGSLHKYVDIDEIRNLFTKATK